MKADGAAPVHPVFQTVQQQNVFDIYHSLKEVLERAPTVTELQQRCTSNKQPLLSVDRYQKIVAEINQQLGESARLSLTTNRLCFIYNQRVMQAFRAHYAQYFEAPNFDAFHKQLQQQHIPVSTTTLRFIISTARAQAPKREKDMWHFSRKRLTVGWPEIIDAHGRAAKMLKRQGVKRNPSTEEISYFLELKKITVSARALDFRFRCKPAGVTIEIAPFSDTTLTIIKSCHKSLNQALGRNPNIGELTKAVNHLSLKSFSPEAIWTRITDYNNTHQSKKISLTATLRSGIYDSDIVTCHANLLNENNRAPTFRELFAKVLKERAPATIRQDTFHRRLSSLNLNLTQENELKAQKQDQVINAIKHLRLALKRAPLKEEVLNLLDESGTPMSLSEMNTAFTTFKKRMRDDQRKQVGLGFPHRHAAKLINAHELLSNQLARDITIKDLSRKTGWSEQGVIQLLPVATRHLIKQGKEAPLLIAGTDAYRNLGLLADFILNVNHPAHSIHLREIDDGLKSVIREWLGPGCGKKSFYTAQPELSKMRLQILWLAGQYYYTADQKLSTHANERALAREMGWAHRNQFPTIHGNPFSGVAHALVGAYAMGRAQARQIKDFLQFLGSAVVNDNPLHAAVDYIDALAGRTGFPQTQQRLSISA